MMQISTPKMKLPENFSKSITAAYTLLGSMLVFGGLGYYLSIIYNNYGLIYKEQKRFKKAIKFFNKGSSGTWQDILDNTLAQKIESKFKKEMKKLNYI